MNLLYRFVMFILIILFMFACLLLAIYSFTFTGRELLPGIINSIYNQWELGLLFLLGFAAGAWIIYPFFTRKESGNTRISSSELGRVDISLAALDKLVYKVAMKHEGVKEIESRLRAAEDGLHIVLTGKILPSIPLPDLTERLQNRVRNYLQDTTGVNVAEVRVIIEGIGEEGVIEDVTVKRDLSREAAAERKTADRVKAETGGDTESSGERNEGEEKENQNLVEQGE